MSKLLRASSGQHNESDSVSGPSSYPTGGFSISTKLGRVDSALVQTNGSVTSATKDSIADNNKIVVKVSNISSGSEVSAGTDLSGDTFDYSAYRL